MLDEGLYTNPLYGVLQDASMDSPDGCAKLHTSQLHKWRKAENGQERPLVRPIKLI